MSKGWKVNITEKKPGIFRTMNGNSDEFIAIGRVIKAGFSCSKVDITNAKYDAVIDISNTKTKLLRIQIKGTSTGILNFQGGVRSGKQIDRKAKSRAYIYTKKDCDIIFGINSHNGDCYIIPVEDIKNFGNSRSLSKLEEYKENWDYFLELRKKVK